MNLRGLPSEWRDRVTARALVLGLFIAPLCAFPSTDPRPFFAVAAAWMVFVGIVTGFSFRKDPAVEEPVDCAIHMAWLAFMGAMMPTIFVGGLLMECRHP